MTVIPKTQTRNIWMDTETPQCFWRFTCNSLVIQNEDSVPTCYLHPVNKGETFLPYTCIKSQNGIIDFEKNQPGFEIRNNHQPHLEGQDNPYNGSRKIRSDIYDPIDRKRKSTDEISSASLAQKRANLSFNQTECYSNSSTEQRMGCLEIKNQERQIKIHSKMSTLLNGMCQMFHLQCHKL